LIAALPVDEVERLRVLRSLELLDTPPEPAFDALVQAASAIADAESAAVSLIDAGRQWFKARLGLDGTETSRDDAFCAHAILESGVLCIDDTRNSLLFADNPFVTGDPGIRAYAGAPISINGQNVGTVCAFSSRPRPWSPAVKEALASLAAGAAQMLETRRQLAFKDRLLLSMSDGVLATNGDGRVTFWSPTAEAILGWTAEEIIGRSISCVVPLSHWARHEKGFARVRQTGHDGFGGRPEPVRALHRNGYEIPVELTLATWRGGDDVTVAAIVRDCSERAALAEARSANVAKDRFLATMSHELRTPLNGLVALSAVLARTELSPAQAEIVGVMQSAGESLERLLTDALDTANLSSGSLELRTEDFDLSPLLDRVVAKHRPAADAKGVGLACSGPDAAEYVQADAGRLEQILDRLIGNAVKFTERGAVRLLVRRPTPGQWRFEITDTGAGFSPDFMARLFAPFATGDDSTTRAHGGSGLGLALSRRLAREMGGDLEAENRLEGGARLTLTLPMPACAPLEGSITRAA
jgi:PAS domain S-box-containing protein